MDKVLYHLGIIMDGNRRWAKERGFPELLGHKAGAEKVKEVIGWCKIRGIKVLTLYAFSTENWSRSIGEVNFLMKLGIETLTKKLLKELQENKVKLLVIGQREKLPDFVRGKIEEAENLTKNNEELTLIIAVSYGGKDEIIRAVKRAILLKGVKPEDLTEEKIESCLDTADLPDPDLIIRTGGEQRLSNFLVWQSAYSELYFCPKYWPDFSEDDLDEALTEHARRQRRFGR